jgi:hypothetical protein
MRKVVPRVGMAVTERVSDGEVFGEFPKLRKQLWAGESWSGRLKTALFTMASLRFRAVFAHPGLTKAA